MQNQDGEGDIWRTDPVEMAKMKIPSWDLVPGEKVEVIPRGTPCSKALTPTFIPRTPTCRNLLYFQSNFLT